MCPPIQSVTIVLMMLLLLGSWGSGSHRASSSGWHPGLVAELREANDSEGLASFAPLVVVFLVKDGSQLARVTSSQPAIMTS